MPTRQNTNFPRLKSDDEFENLILDLCRLEWNDKFASDRNGRSGQNQNGVDIVGNPNGDINIYYGAQCKLRTGDKQLSQRDIEIEIEKADDFVPSLKLLIIVTDAPRDANIQEFIRLVNGQNKRRNSFAISIWFWDSICQRIEAYPDLIIKYYRDHLNILTTAPNAEHLVNIPLSILSICCDRSTANSIILSLDEALELRGTQIFSQNDACFL